MNLNDGTGEGGGIAIGLIFLCIMVLTVWGQG